MRDHTKLRARSKITSQNCRSDLGEIWLLQLSEAIGIVNYFDDFTIERQPKMARSCRWENVKLFLSEPLVPERTLCVFSEEFKQKDAVSPPATIR